MLRLASGARKVATTYRPPDPVASYIVGAVDFVNGLGMTGHNGTRRIGEKAGPGGMVFRGDCGPLQFFQGAASLLPRGTTGPQGFNTALPNTHGPVARPNGVLDTIGATQGGL